MPQGPPGDRIIVMAKTKYENTDWVTQYLSNWQHAIYSADDPDAQLPLPANKGHESMAYLTYIIQNYDKLPSTIAFLHPHRNGWLAAWHNDAPGHDNVESLNHLRIDTLERRGYVNLRCKWAPGCKLSHRKNAHITEEIWQEVFNTTEPVPELVGAACCAQFAVTRQQVHKRPRKDYERIRRWVLETDKTDAKSGRVMEFLWHVIFGQEAV
ncbi:MAG: hypothetical protein M1825_000900 [Sarcosagium campestre]|nr:MAG: hypothetical protein M1825_000900 [Sarcosagium campestre]